MNTLPATTHIGRVALKIASLDHSIQFYEKAIGFNLLSRNGDTAELGIEDGKPLLRLREVKGARQPGRTTGLYHFAILTPGRVELATALFRLVKQDYPLQGASDHGVSEALYLSDPEGNGIEIYRDRVKEEWPRDSKGNLAMTSARLDLNDLVRVRDEAQAQKMAADTRIGHIHLHVAYIQPALDYYVEGMGFDLIQRYGPSAAFVSAGGYHHHVGMNTWNGEGAPQPAEDQVGLDWYEVLLPDGKAEDVAEKLRQSGHEVEETENGLFGRDPSGNRVLISQN